MFDQKIIQIAILQTPTTVFCQCVGTNCGRQSLKTILFSGSTKWTCLSWFFTKSFRNYCMTCLRVKQNLWFMHDDAPPHFLLEENILKQRLHKLIDNVKPLHGHHDLLISIH